MMRGAFLLLLSSLAAQGAVVVTGSSGTVTASNACISFTLGIAGPNGGRMTSLKFKGAELPGNGGSGYTIVVDSVGVSWSIGRTALDHSVRRGANFADVAVIHRSEDAIPFEFELHYLLRAEECGFHEYSVYRYIGNAAHPTDTIAQFVTTLRTDPKIFRNHSSELYWSGILPLPAHLAGSGDLQDATYNLTQFPDDPYYRPPDRWNYTKYDFSTYEKNHLLHGLYGGGYGIWCIHTPLSKETWNGGPTKQNLTVHGTVTTPVLLNEYFNAHYGQGSTALKVPAGWTKTYGPWFFYVNQGDTSNAAGYQAMWMDAVRYSDSAEHRAFYDVAQIPGYLPSSGRATVTGTIKLSTGDSMLGATVVLSDNGVPFDQSLAGYQYWADTAADGSFAVKDVRPGKYRLSAYRTGVFDDFHVDDVAVTAPSTAVGDHDWTPAGTQGTTVLQIGMPDRTAMEFKDGDRYKHYGLFNDEAVCFPNGVRYVFGLVEGMLPASDRDGWFFTQWRSYRQNYRDGGYAASGPTVRPPD